MVSPSSGVSQGHDRKKDSGESTAEADPVACDVADHQQEVVEGPGVTLPQFDAPLEELLFGPLLGTRGSGSRR